MQIHSIFLAFYFFFKCPQSTTNLFNVNVIHSTLQLSQQTTTTTQLNSTRIKINDQENIPTRKKQKKNEKKKFPRLLEQRVNKIRSNNSIGINKVINSSKIFQRGRNERKKKKKKQKKV